MLKLNGSVTISLTGKLAVRGRIANNTMKPEKLHIESSYSRANGVSIVGGAHTVMTLLAPRTTVTISGGPFYGTLLAGTVNLTGDPLFHAEQH